MHHIPLDFNKKYGKWSIIEHLPYVKGKCHKYRCLCACGEESIVQGKELRLGKSSQCRKCGNKEVSKKLSKDLTGQKFGKWIVIKRVGTTRYHRPIWLCKCECGRIGEIPSSNLLSKSSKKCRSCNQHMGIKGAVLARIQNSAKNRNIECIITKKEIWDLWLKQKGLCAITGIQLTLPNLSTDLYSASLDRINNNLGYTKDNCQWVHKIVNRMKYVLNNDEFISIAYAIVNTHKQNPNIDWNKTTYYRNGTKKTSKNYENGIIDTNLQKEE